MRRSRRCRSCRPTRSRSWPPRSPTAAQRIAVLAQRPPLGTYRSVTWINAGRRLEAYAHDLYANLRTLDKAGCARILVQAVPSDERWDAVRDRLRRAPRRAPATPSMRVTTRSRPAFCPEERSALKGMLP